MRNVLALLAALPLALFAPRDLASGEGEGTIAGKAVLVGPPPAAAPPTTVKPVDAPACGAHMADESVRLADGGGVRDVIVYVENAPPGAAPPGTVQLTNHSCRFQPRVQTASLRSTLVVGNDDNILHNTHGYFEDGATFFNVGLPFRGVKVSRPLARPGMIRFKCDAGHTWMSGYLLVLEHRFHTSTDATGGFTLPPLPPGSYRVKAWHEKLKGVTVPVEVRAGQETRVTLELKG